MQPLSNVVQPSRIGASLSLCLSLPTSTLLLNDHRLEKVEPDWSAWAIRRRSSLRPCCVGCLSPSSDASLPSGSRYRYRPIALQTFSLSFSDNNESNSIKSPAADRSARICKPRAPLYTPMQRRAKSKNLRCLASARGMPFFCVQGK